MRRLKMIFNPVADRGHAAQSADELQEAVEAEVAAARENGQDIELTWTRTQYKGHAVDLARDAVAEGFEVVTAIGGDGTVHEVVNGLMAAEKERRPALGVIPFGSGNDFAHNVGLPSDPREAARCLFGDTTRTVDVGTIKDGSGRCEYWTNTVGIGFGGAVNMAARKYTRIRGFFVYLAAVFETIASAPFSLKAKIQVDGNGPVEHEVAMIAFCNGPREGGGFFVGPGAEMDDGLITYMLMRNMSRVNMLRFLPIVMTGNHLKYPRYFQRSEARHIVLETDRTMAIHADGEVFGSWEAGIRQLELGIVPSAVRVLTNC